MGIDIETYRSRIGSHFSGRQKIGSHSSGKRRIGSHSSGKRRIGSHFSGRKRIGSHSRIGSYFARRRRFGSNFSWRRRIGSSFSGKQRIGGHSYVRRRIKQSTLRKSTPMVQALRECIRLLYLLVALLSKTLLIPAMMSMVMLMKTDWVYLSCLMCLSWQSSTLAMPIDYVNGTNNLAMIILTDNRTTTGTTATPTSQSTQSSEVGTKLALGLGCTIVGAIFTAFLAWCKGKCTSPEKYFLSCTYDDDENDEFIVLEPRVENAVTKEINGNIDLKFSSSKPWSKVKFKRSNEELTTKDNHIVDQNKRTILNLQKSDAGLYEIEIPHKYLWWSSHLTVKLKLKEKLKTKYIYGFVGKEVELKYESTDKSTANCTTQWKKDDRILLDTQPAIPIHKELAASTSEGVSATDKLLSAKNPISPGDRPPKFTHVVVNAMSADSGSYKIGVKNNDGHTEQEFKLEIVEKPAIEISPAVGKVPKHVKIRCKCSTEHITKIEWEQRVEGEQWQPLDTSDSERYGMSADESEVNILHSSTEDSGKYRCKVLYRQTTTPVLVEEKPLQMIEKPEIVLGPSVCTIPGPITITCKCDKDYIKDIKWMVQRNKKTQIKDLNAEYKMFEDKTRITIDQSKTDHAGYYFCHITYKDKIGITADTVESKCLQIIETPKIELEHLEVKAPERVMLKCLCSRNELHSICWQKKHKDGQEFQKIQKSSNPQYSWKDSDSELIISQTKATDTGFYRCVLQYDNLDGELKTEGTYLDVKGEEKQLIAELKKIYENNCSEIQQKPWDKCRGTFNLDKIYIERTLQMNDQTFECNGKLFFDDRFNKSNVFSILGNAGMGKSTLASKIAYDWAKNERCMAKIKCLFRVKVKNLNSSVEEYLMKEFENAAIPEKKKLKEKICDLLECDGTLLVLDGVDQVHEDSAKHLKNLFKDYKYKYSHLKILAAARPNYLNKYTDTDRFNTFELKPFTKEDIRSYFGKYVEEKKDSPELMDIELFDKTAKILKTPIFCAMVCTIWENEKKLPDYTGGLYSKFIETLKKLYTNSGLDLYTKSDLDIAERIENHLCNLGKFALLKLLKNSKLVFKGTDFERFDIVPDIACRMGLLELEKGSDHQEDRKYSFVHTSFQEFLAADFVLKSESTDSDINGEGVFKYMKEHHESLFVDFLHEIELPENTFSPNWLYHKVIKEGLVDDVITCGVEGNALYRTMSERQAEWDKEITKSKGPLLITVDIKPNIIPKDSFQLVEGVHVKGVDNVSLCDKIVNVAAQLRYLIMSEINVGKIVAGLTEMRNIERLELSNCNLDCESLRQILTGVSKLPKLKFLNLSYNSQSKEWKSSNELTDFSKVDKDIVSDFPALKYLNLDGCKLILGEPFFEVVKGLEHLEKLLLKDNDLSKLDSDKFICMLPKSVKTVNIERCDLFVDLHRFKDQLVNVQLLQ